MSPDTDPPTSPDSEVLLRRQVDGLSTLLQLEQEARSAETTTDLAFIIANETRRLTPYKQAFVWRLNTHGKCVLQTVMGAARFERTAPFIQWLEKFGQWCISRPDEARRTLTAENVDAQLAGDWAQHLPSHMLVLPLTAPNGKLLGLVAMVRDEPWAEGEQMLVARLVEAYGHAWTGLAPGHETVIQRFLNVLSNKKLMLVAAAFLAAILFFPVSQSVIAPVRVTPTNAGVVAAPMDGVIASFVVTPNQSVEKGDILFRIDDTNLRNRRDVAQKALEVARAEFERISKQAFYDPESKSRIAELAARVDQRAAEAAFTEELLGRVNVRADRSGIAVFQDANEWLGRPVVTGERVLRIANPEKVELRADLPVDSLLNFPPNARAQAFLNVAPLSPLEATVQTISYEPRATPAGVLAYRVTARLQPSSSPPRIGLKGVAKIYGERVSLFWYLMRKPISAIRRVMGM